MTDLTDYYRRASGAESPTGEDNRAGSGAFSKYQFMPATAAGLAQRTPWGKGLTPDTVKAAVMADPRRADELMTLYTGDSNATLARAGMQPTPTNLFALHRFGPAGGLSLLNAPATMPTADWVRSVNWGEASPDAVISQNGLNQYANVGDLRKRFIAGQIGGSITQPTWTGEGDTQEPGAPAPGAAAPGAAAPTPEPVQQALTIPPPVFENPLSALYTAPEDDTKKRQADRRRKLALFG